MKSLGSLREEGEVLTEKTEEAEGVQPGGLERGGGGGRGANWGSQNPESGHLSI